MVGTSDLGHDGRRLAVNATVTALTRHVVLPARGDEKPIPVAFGELQVLLALAQRPSEGLGPVAARLAAELDLDVDDVERTIADLDRIGLLATGEPPAAELLPEPAPTAPVELPADAPVVLVTPLSFRVTERGFEALDHDGRLRARLDAVELDAITALTTPATPAEAAETHRERAGRHALDLDGFHALLDRLLAADVVHVFDETRPDHTLGRDRAARLQRASVGQEMRVRTATRKRMSEHIEAAERKDAEVGFRRVRIVPIHQNPSVPPLGLAMVMAYAKAIDDGRLEEHYDFRPDWLAHDRTIENLTPRPGIFLVSNYIWSHRDNIHLAERIKAASPNSVMIHGGPDTPKYKGDVIDYFAANPHVDIAIHVEGEVSTAEVLTKLIGKVSDAGPADLSVLHDVAGISYRDGDRVVQTPTRDRLEDLDVIPSPYLTGMFDNYGDAPVTSITIETNRGCPYGCTFCDWGSATMSRIRKFDLDRVFAELEWAAKRGIHGIGFADANFGILERDVAIARKVAELKATYGFPSVCATNYAKNTVKHLQKIVQMWVDAGIVTQGMLSLQTMDTETLTTIRRSNIKTEKYDALAEEFRKADLPLFVDLMMGLPGQTVASFRHDLQDTLEREVVAKIHPTTLLWNSPMNEPEYKKLHRIEIAKNGNLAEGNRFDQTVVATSTFTREDYETMKVLRRDFLMFENFGMLRHLARYVRQEAGVFEVDLYDHVSRTARAEPERWPALEFVVTSGPEVMAPPVSWRLFVDEVHRLVVDQFGVADDDALASALTAQHALLPAPDRSYPARVELAHDFLAWHADMLAAKAQVGPDWTSEVPHLRTYGPGVLEVADPHHLGTQGMGYPLEQGWLDTWDLESPVARPTMARELTT